MPDEWLRPCEIVVIDSLYRGNVLNAGWTSKRVTRGSQLFGGVVHMCKPDPCIFTYTSRVKFAKPARYRVEKLTYNYMVVAERAGRVDRFMYPIKVWDIMTDLVNSFMTQEKMPQQGSVLYGPPGTGKTSMAKLAADISGVSTVEIRPDVVYEMWLGRSEQNLLNKMIEAETTEPSMVLVDDGEWLLLDRGRKGWETSASTQLSLMNILLEFIERWNRTGRRIFFLTTTNAPLDLLDKALLRSGRLGRPIYIPLPDFEAVYEFLVNEGVDANTARKWAYRAVNSGLSMADVKLNILPKLRAGQEPLIETQLERGYRRYILDVEQKYVREVDQYLSALANILRGSAQDIAAAIRHRQDRGSRTVIWVAGKSHVATAVANALFSYHVKLPTITLVDARRLEDAVEAANSLRGVLIVPDHVAEGLKDAVFSSAMSVVYAGEAPREAPRVPVTVPNMPIEAMWTALAAIVLGFYGFTVDDAFMRNFINMAKASRPDDVVNVLNRAGYYGNRPGQLHAGVLLT